MATFEAQTRCVIVQRTALIYLLTVESKVVQFAMVLGFRNKSQLGANFSHADLSSWSHFKVLLRQTFGRQSFNQCLNNKKLNDEELSVSNVKLNIKKHNFSILKIMWYSRILIIRHMLDQTTSDYRKIPDYREYKKKFVCTSYSTWKKYVMYLGMFFKSTRVLSIYTYVFQKQRNLHT